MIPVVRLSEVTDVARLPRGEIVSLSYSPLPLVKVHQGRVGTVAIQVGVVLAKVRELRQEVEDLLRLVDEPRDDEEHREAGAVPRVPPLGPLR